MATKHGLKVVSYKSFCQCLCKGVSLLDTEDYDLLLTHEKIVDRKRKKEEVENDTWKFIYWE